MNTRYATLLTGVLALGMSQTALSFETGDWLIRAGVINVNPDSSNGTINALSADVEVDDDTQLGLNVTYFVTSNIAIELLAATPFKHDIDVGNGAVTGETKHLPPSVIANWYPLSADSTLQPYVGAGLNYTIFFEEETSAGDLEIDNSVGLTAQVGVDYQISDKLFLNAQARYIDISTDATVAGSIDFDLDIDPMVYMVGLGLKL